MRRKKPRARKPMPRPTVAFQSRKMRELDKAWRKMLNEYHGMFVDKRLDG